VGSPNPKNDNNETAWTNNASDSGACGQVQCLRFESINLEVALREEGRQVMCVCSFCWDRPWTLILHARIFHTECTIPSVQEQQQQQQSQQ